MNAKSRTTLLVIAALTALCASVATLVHLSKPETLYPQTAIVVSTDEDQNLLTLMTANGHLFVYETAIEDWLPGDICSLIMSTKGTVSIKDDEIIEIWYSGRPEDYTYLPYDGKGMVN